MLYEVITPRAWSMLSNILKNTKDIKTINPIIYGSVGYGAGIEFVSFVKVYKTLPDIDAILEGRCEDVPEA